jgi:hypothetical protein
MINARWLVGMCSMGSVVLAGCGSSGPATGSEGGSCYGNGTCNAPLVCLSELCVRLPGDDAGMDAGGDGAVGHDCDVLEQTGCGDHQGCFLVALDDGDGGHARDDAGIPLYHTVCLAVGGTAAGETCADINDCVAGARCYEGRCLEYCAPTPGEPCVPTTPDSSLGVLAMACDPVVQNCPWDGWACILGVCMPQEGSAAEGEPCFFVFGDCALGLACFPDFGAHAAVCRPYCDTREATTCAGSPWHDCVSLDDLSQNRFGLEAHVGLCLTVPE